MYIFNVFKVRFEWKKNRFRFLEFFSEGDKGLGRNFCYAHQCVLKEYHGNIRS